MENSPNTERILLVDKDLFHPSGLGVGSDHRFSDTHSSPPEYFPCVNGICLPSLCETKLAGQVRSIETLIDLTRERADLSPNGNATIFLIKPEGVLANLNDSIHLLTGPDTRVVGLYKLELSEQFLHWLYPQWVGGDGSYHSGVQGHMTAGPSYVGFVTGEQAIGVVRRNQGRWGTSSGLRGVFRDRTDGNEPFWREWKQRMGMNLNPIGIERGFYNGIHSAHDVPEYIRMAAGINATNLLGSEVSKELQAVAELVYRKPDTYLRKMEGGDL
jgi:hypothetical protein